MIELKLCILFDAVDTEVPLVRLVGGGFPFEGRVEVFINGQWGSVCDDFFSWYEGSVVCRQLNFTGFIRVGDKGEFGVGSGPIWLDDVYCYGDETSITQCFSNGYGVHNCDHSEDVGVVCGKCPDECIPECTLSQPFTSLFPFTLILYLLP